MAESDQIFIRLYPTKNGFAVQHRYGLKGIWITDEMVYTTDFPETVALKLPSQKESANIGSGTRLYGYCNGFFGRDYENKTIETIGSDWVVVRNTLNEPILAFFRPGWQAQDMGQLLLKWADPATAWNGND